MNDVEELGLLTADQQRRLDELSEGLDQRGRDALWALARLRNMEASWRHDRMATVYAAALALDAGLIDLDSVLNALAISRPTWYRRRAELREWLAGHGIDAAGAAGDQAATGAREITGEHDDEGTL